MKALFVIDAVHETGGAHVATRLLIRELLKRGHQIGIIGCTDPTDEQRRMLSGVRFSRCFSERGFWGWLVRRLDWHVFHRGVDHPWILDPLGCARRLMRRYDTVCVMSEGSIFRRMVGGLPQPVRKIQLIHTNYLGWSRLAHRNIAHDLALYAKMDAIGCVGKIGAEQLEASAPTCRGKVFPFYNVIDLPVRIACSRLSNKGPIRLVTLARVTDKSSKDGSRMIRVAQKLKGQGLSFTWDVYGGGGPGLDELRQEVVRSGLSDCFHLHGNDPAIRQHLAEFDLFVLLSHFEGLPNVIYESLVAGVPVFSTSVGGVPEQVRENETGWLVEDDEGTIVQGLGRLLKRRDCLVSVHGKLVSYMYDNKKIVDELCGLLVSPKE